MRAAVLVNGRVDDYAWLERWVAQADYIVAANGGLHHCRALGCTPHVIVGDLDSAPPELVAHYRGLGSQVEGHPRAKDKTDLELAVERAIRDGATEVILLGALGGRLDQAMANLMLLARADWPVPVSLAEANQVARVLQGDTTLELDLPPGALVSALPISQEVTGITYRGLEYPLEDGTLVRGSTRGVSNVVVESPVTVRVGRGVLMVVYEVETDRVLGDPSRGNG